MEFESPRFAGDSVLEEILNDPDTGTKKLQPGSPVESVTKVQQALFELGWTSRIDTPVLDPAVFVIGIYGPLTTKTVEGSWKAEIPDSVQAQVRGGRVILHGDVESASQRDTAESAVRQLTGVRVVDNLIRVNP